MKDYKYAVVIGRFQPVHKAHITLIEKALEIADELIIVLGSNRSAPTVKNPWSPLEREEMIISCFRFPDYYRSKGRYVFKMIGDAPKIHFTTVKDHPYNNTFWMTAVQQKVSDVTCHSSNDKIVLVGNNKDRSSFYLDFFPQWNKKEFKVCDKLMSATDIRDMYFSPNSIHIPGLNIKENSELYEKRLHPNVIQFLIQWQETDLYKKLADEFSYYQDYHDSFANTPFPVTFVTTDVVVVKSGHVLLIRRKVNPGQGLLALPGGFLNPDEWIIDCAFRELKEETRIKIDKKILKEHVVEQRVFDHPDRSLRGRSITHAFFVKLPDGGELPEVKGGDDAAGAFWLPLGDLSLHEHEFFEDHIHIISHFVNKW